jgi:hypothetical protein
MGPATLEERIRGGTRTAALFFTDFLTLFPIAFFLAGAIVPGFPGGAALAFGAGFSALVGVDVALALGVDPTAGLGVGVELAGASWAAA